MSKQMLLLGSIIAGSVLFTGCATILGGGNNQTISINSSVPMKGEMAYSDGTGTQYFTTPATLSVERKSKDVTLKSRNEEFTNKTVKADMNPWFLGNIIFGGLFGSTTDMAGGAAWKYDETVNLSEK